MLFRSLAMDGNSAPYLQYAVARIASVLDKHCERFPGVEYQSAPLVLDSPFARRLGLRLARYPDAIVDAATQEKPSLLADTLYDLSQAYSSFYQNVPFLKAEAGLRESRVRLCALTAHILRHGLDLLGIDTPERI